jgi:hypothetical protein
LPSGEVLQVLGERVQVLVPAVTRHVLVLGSPVVAEKTAVKPEDCAAVLAGLDEVLHRVERAVRGLATPVREPLRRVPSGYRGLRGEVADPEGNLAALARLDLVRPHEPRVDPWAGGDRFPHLLTARVELGSLVQLEFPGHFRNPSLPSRPL